MIALLALHAALGLVAVAWGERLGRRALALGVVGPVVAVGWLLVEAGGALDGRPVEQRVAWVPHLGLALDLRLDGFGVLMVALVSGIGVAVFAYAASYLPARGPGLGRLVGLLTLFSGAMLGVVLADNLFLLATCWELTSVLSYLLIGNDHTRPQARAAALHALLITGGGGLVMALGFVCIGQAGGTFRLSALLAAPPSGTAVTVGLGLVLVGAFTKSAQYPFHSWLPRAMVAPTPVSAYLHSATMVQAGVFLVARLAPAFATTPGWRPMVLAVGLTTMVAGGLRALRQHDLKLLLAFGTVSQLGFLVVVFGIGTPEATAAGCLLLLVHALFKAALFMVVGIVDHETGTRDSRELPNLAAGWGSVKVVATASAASMAGIPLLAGFVAKESVYRALGRGDFTGGRWVLAIVVAASAVTTAYSARFTWVLLRLGPRGAGTHTRVRRRASVWFLAPAGVLAVVSVVLGLRPGLLDRLVGSAGAALGGDAGPAHLVVWHGFDQALALSAVTLGAGAALFAARSAVSRALAVGARLPSGTDAYLSALRGLRIVAVRVTAVVQSGSLPVYGAVILLTAAALPGVALVRSRAWPGWPVLVEAPAQIPIVAALVGAALGAAVVRHRFAAALFLGTAGYAMAGLFVVQGAPDLALTQAAIETLTTVVFVLVLRRLPDRFERRSSALGRAGRAAVAGAVGLMVFTFALTAAGNRTAEPVSTEMVARSLPDGHGRNVVNVILVDFRGLDTLGEITVLAAAAIGAVALARASRRPDRSAGQADAVGEAAP